MSTLKVDNIRHNSATSDAITMASDGTCTAKITGVTGGGALSHRRLNINGSFLVWQRATSVAVSDGSNEGFQAADRMLFKFGGASAGACTVSRSTDVPTRSGFVYSYKIDVTTANSLSTNDHIQNEYIFEGQDILSSGWDYKDPNSYLTISLYLKTNKSGNPKLPLTLRFNDSAGNYRYYTEDITIVGTGWGRYSISIPGDASANDIANNTTDGCTLFICWSTGSGLVGTTGTWRSDAHRASSNSANFFDSTSNDMYMTGLQFEVGNTMTSYEHRTFADELRRCQRYYYQVGGQTNDGQPDEPYGVLLPMAMNASSTRVKGVLTHPVPMRAGPSVSGGGSGTCLCQCGDTSSSTVLVFQDIWTASNTARHTWIDMSPNSGTVSLIGETGIVYANNSTYHFKVSAEI